MKVILSVLLVLVLAAPAAARERPSIEAPDGLRFGESFEPTLVLPTRYRGGLWARGECQQDSVVWVQWVNYDDTSSQDGPFTLGPTPSWSGGGASCRIELWSTSGIYPDHLYAKDTFEVLP